jgi:hypothetical protein
MKPRTIELAIVFLSGALVCACSHVAVTDPPTMVAQGKQSQPDNIHRATFGPKFANDRQLIEALSNLQSPGLGYFMANQVGGHLDQSLDLVYVELPEDHLNRYFALEYKLDGTIQVVDEFIAPNEPEITRVHRHSSGTLQYAQSNGIVVLPHRDP